VKTLKKVLGIVDRVLKKKAIGIIYNIHKDDEAALQNYLLDEKHIVVKGSDAYTSAMLLFRLGKRLNTKHLQFKMIPGFINGYVICITGADGIKSSYSRVLDEFNKYKIPLLLLMHSDAPMKDFRKLGAYQRVLTIEQDYSTL
jgi:hypothetical protein